MEKGICPAHPGGSLSSPVCGSLTEARPSGISAGCAAVRGNGGKSSFDYGLSSHILSEVDLLADTIGIIQHGKLLTELPIEEIHKHQTDYISLQVDDVTRVAALLENMRITNFSVLDKEFIHIYDSDISGKALSKAIIENGIGLESMGRKQDTLEDFFFQLTEEEK